MSASKYDNATWLVLTGISCRTRWPPDDQSLFRPAFSSMLFLSKLRRSGAGANGGKIEILFLLLQTRRFQRFCLGEFEGWTSPACCAISGEGEAEKKIGKRVTRGNSWHISDKTTKNVLR
jgi:hypothetical protein